MSKFSPDAIARRAQQAGVEPGPHGPVGEQFMRHYYGPSGYSPAKRQTENVEHVAWCRYVSPTDWPTRIAMCDSDSPGAFRVFHERELRELEEQYELRMIALKATAAERDALRHDLDRLFAASNELAAENAALRADADEARRRGLVTGLVAVSVEPRYAGWVFVRHADGVNWTTGAKLTPETWQMLAAAIDAARSAK